MVYRGAQKPNYYVISKEKIRGQHVVTPYASRPQNARRSEIVVSGKQQHYKLNKNGFALTKKLPTKGVLKSKPKRRQTESFGLLGGFGYQYRR